MLVGSNLLLRAVEPTDVDYLFRSENDAEIWNYGSTITPFSKSTMKAYAESIHDIDEQKQFRFIIELKNENSVIGMVDLYEYDSFNARAGIGIIITDVNQRRQGYAKESIELILNYCKNVLFLNQLFCTISSDNVFSVDLFGSIGFDKVGTQVKWTKIGKDTWSDQVLMQYLL